MYAWNFQKVIKKFSKSLKKLIEVVIKSCEKWILKNWSRGSNDGRGPKFLQNAIFHFSWLLTDQFSWESKQRIRGVSRAKIFRARDISTWRKFVFSKSQKSCFSKKCWQKKFSKRVDLWTDEKIFKNHKFHFSENVKTMFKEISTCKKI
jgi:hypothetical protein